MKRKHTYSESAANSVVRMFQNHDGTRVGKAGGNREIAVHNGNNSLVLFIQQSTKLYFWLFHKL
jgi:hypothetical protein